MARAASRIDLLFTHPNKKMPEELAIKGTARSIHEPLPDIKFIPGNKRKNPETKRREAIQPAKHFTKRLFVLILFINKLHYFTYIIIYSNFTKTVESDLTDDSYAVNKPTETVITDKIKEEGLTSIKITFTSRKIKTPHSYYEIKLGVIFSGGIW